MSFIPLSIQKNLYSASNTALTFLTKPIQTLTGRFEKAYEETEKESAKSLVLQGASNVLIATAGAKAIVSAVKVATPLTKLGLTALGLFGAPVLISNPKLIPEPSKIATAGAQLGELTKEPSLNAGISYIKAHPALSIGALTSALGLLGYGSLSVASLITNYRNTQAIKENTEANQTIYNPSKTDANSDYKDQIKIIEAQTKQQEDILKAQTKQAKELYELQTITPPVVAPQGVAPGAVIIKEKKKKRKKKAKKKQIKKKKKTRRSKKKSIKRRKSKR